MVTFVAMLDIAQLDPEQRRPITRAEYHVIGEAGLFEDERVELIEGVIVRLAPRGAPHDSTIERLSELLLPRLVGRARIRIQLAFVASEYSEPEPDVAVVPRDEPWDEHPSHAALLIEVADSSLRFDRGTKGSVYARAGVPEYWVVNVVERTIEVFGAPDGERYTTATLYRGSDVLAVPGFPDVSFSVVAVFNPAP
ncbi:MAG TPA: Uma2 family endonuclease [Polyangiaceae bacterium]